MKYSTGFKVDGDEHISFVPPLPTEEMRGGITARSRINESIEVVVDANTSRAYVSIDNATKTSPGLMSAEDKLRLDNINDFINVDTVNASSVVEDSTHRFVTDEEKSTWNNKADTTLATLVSNGLMSKEDKAKVDAIPLDPKYTDTVYTHPDTHPATMIVEDSTHRFVTYEQIVKIDLIPSNPKYTDTVYTHPDTHPATMIVTDDTHKFVTKDQIAKIDAIPTDPKYTDTVYVHPDTHPATMIEEDEEHRFVTDEQIAKWDEVISSDSFISGGFGDATNDSSGLMSAEDKAKLDGIEENANNYVHPDTHPATMIVTDDTHKFVTSEQMIKIDLIPSNPKYTDTVYVHPETHPATMIVEDSTHRFVTDAEKTVWNNKASTDVASVDTDGLMSAEDKLKFEQLLVKVEQLQETVNNLQSSNITVSDDGQGNVTVE